MLGTNKGMLIARWNGSLLPDGRNTMSPHAMRMRIPMTDMHIDLVLKAGVHTVVSEDWLRSPEFMRMAVECGSEDDEVGGKAGKIDFWYSETMPEEVKINAVGLRPDLAESLRQVVSGASSPKSIGTVSFMPGKDSSITTPFAVDHYIPFLQRVIEEEKARLNRQDIIAACEKTMAAWKERI